MWCSNKWREVDDDYVGKLVVMLNIAKLLSGFYYCCYYYYHYYYTLLLSFLMFLFTDGEQKHTLKEIVKPGVI